MAQMRVPVLEKFEYQQKVSSVLSVPPATPVKGDRYIVGAAPTLAWIGKENNIAWYNGVVWMFDIPLAGWQAYLASTSRQMLFSGTAWVLEGTTLTEVKADADIASAISLKHDGAAQDVAIASKTTLAAVKSDVDVASAISLKHDGAAQDAVIAGKTTLAAVKADVDVANAISKAHTAGTDQGLDTGGVNAITAAQAKEAYTKRGVYDVALGVIMFDL